MVPINATLAKHKLVDADHAGMSYKNAVLALVRSREVAGNREHVPGKIEDTNRALLEFSRLHGASMAL